MKTLAAVLVETGRPLELAELEIPALKPGQVLVEIAFSGVCHTQLLESRGHRGKDAFLPHCLGHEGSGKALEVGPGATKIKPGERVVLSWIKGSGAEAGGTVYRWAGRGVNAGPVTTFARHAVVSENRLTRLPDGLALDASALLGCAIPTGVGSVINAARAQAGQSLVVFGAGGIGLCATAGAKLAGCAPIVAVDMRADRLALALRLGATHALLASETDVATEIQRLCPGGADIAIEATGRPAVMREALLCVRAQGGSAVVVGNARSGETLEIDPKQLNLGKRLLGTWGGDNVPDRDFPRYAEWLASGKLDVAPLISRSYPLARINEALDDLESGRAARPLVEMA